MKAYQSRSWGMGATPYFLNAEELATLWHFPTINIKAPLVKKAEARRAEPPVGLPVTFLENTLPGYHEDEEKEALLKASSQHAAEPVSHEPFDMQPLEEALPFVTAPTDHQVVVETTKQFMPDQPVKDEDDSTFSPPNLPV